MSKKHKIVYRALNYFELLLHYKFYSRIKNLPNHCWNFKVNYQGKKKKAQSYSLISKN